VFVGFGVFFMVFGFAYDSEVEGTDELDFGCVNFAVNEDELDGGVEAGSPVDGGGFAGSSGAIDDEGVGNKAVFEAEELPFGSDVELGIGRVGETVLDKIGEELVEGSLEH
jgi:hypothetical protein